MIVLGFIQNCRGTGVSYDYRCLDEGRCPDRWQRFADASYNPRHVPVIPIEAKIWPTHCSVTVLDYRSDHIEDLALAGLEDGLDWTTAKLVAEDYLGSVYHYPR